MPFHARAPVIAPFPSSPACGSGRAVMAIVRPGITKCAAKICGTWRQRNHLHLDAFNLCVPPRIAWKFAGRVYQQPTDIVCKSRNMICHLPPPRLLQHRPSHRHLHRPQPHRHPHQPSRCSYPPHLHPWFHLPKASQLLSGWPHHQLLEVKSFVLWEVEMWFESVHPDPPWPPANKSKWSDPVVKLSRAPRSPKPKRA